MRATLAKVAFALALAAAMTGLVAASLYWRPLNSFIAENIWLGFLLIAPSYPGVVFGMVVSGNAHGGSDVWNCIGIFIQWTILGYVLAGALMRRGSQSKVN